ncbi:hypothetical protein M9Y10_036803 [Tritrichomonas musculus]|uniref:DUF3447 domain-containing protein n=1 Tax=Tritrichomonas musculus TaxID=1915356 RepID=A0ABR2GTW8_9EUKA
MKEDLKEGSEMLLENKNLKYSAENCISPIYIALYCKNYKLVLRFIKEPQLDINAPIDKEQSLFTTLFKQKLNKSHYGGIDINKFVLFVNKAIDELMRQSDLKIFGNYEYSHISIHDSMSKKTKYYDWMNSFSDYIQSIFEYLMSSSEDEIINKNKEKAIDDNKIALACFAAKYLDESILGQFLDDYKIDINSVEENTILYIFFLNEATILMSSVLNFKSDTLNFILTKYKDTIDVNHKTSENVAAIHLLCIHDNISESLIRKGEKKLLEMENLDFNVRNNDSYTPIQLAILNDYYDVIFELLNKPQVDVNVLDDQNNNLLHLCFLDNSIYRHCCYSTTFLKVLSALIDREIDIMAVNKSVFIFFLYLGLPLKRQLILL